MSLHGYECALIAAAVFIGLELLTGTFVLLGFGVGALGVSIAEWAFGPAAFRLDVLVFVVISALSFYVLRTLFSQRKPSAPSDYDVNRY